MDKLEQEHEEKEKAIQEQATFCRMLASHIEDQSHKHKYCSHGNAPDATTTAIRRNIVVLRQELVKLSKLLW